MTRRELLYSTAAPLGAAPFQAAGRRFVKSIASVIFAPGTPLADCFRLAKNAGFDAVEIRLPHGGEIDMTTRPDQIGRIAEAARRTGIAISAIWPSGLLNPNPLNHPHAAMRARGLEAIRRCIGYAPLLGCDALLIVAGRLSWKPELRMGYEDSWKRCNAELAKVIPEAAAAKVLLCVENVWGGFLLSPLEMRNFLDGFGSPWVKSYFDIGNVMRFGYPEDWIRILGPRIRRVHVKDYKLAGNAGDGRFVMLTEGDVPWKEVLAALVDTGYRGFVSPEIGHDPKDPDQLRKVSRNLDKILAMT